MDRDLLNCRLPCKFSRRSRVLVQLWLFWNAFLQFWRVEWLVHPGHMPRQRCRSPRVFLHLGLQRRYVVQLWNTGVARHMLSCRLSRQRCWSPRVCLQLGLQWSSFVQHSN